MADIKVLYVNSDGTYQEHSESLDSIKLNSLKTANHELTDTKLGNLIDGVDAADEHIHDARYFRENEHINASAGAADAAKPIVTDSAGKLSQTFIDIANLNDDLDHGALLGLGDDDHTQYSLADGTRDFSGAVKYASHPSFSLDTQLVDKKYVDDMVAGVEWQDSVLTRTATPPVSPSAGDRYLVIATATGAFAGQEDKIAEYNGTGYTFITPTTGTHLAVDDLATAILLYTGSGWQEQSFEVTTASTGLTKVGNDIQIDSSAAGNGLGFAAGVLSVNVDNSSVELNADALRVKALGIKDSMIDFGTGAGQVSAGDMPLADAGSYFSTDNVEAALQELGLKINAVGVEYTAGTGGVTKGDLVFISSNDTVSKFTSLSSAENCVGLAADTVSAGNPVRVLANDSKLAGVLSSAIAGDTYYWDGSGVTTTIPTGSGAHVFQVGVAKNATDLAVEVVRIKRNA
jgi:hypothetical protein